MDEAAAAEVLDEVRQLRTETGGLLIRMLDQVDKLMTELACTREQVRMLDVRVDALERRSTFRRV